MGNNVNLVEMPKELAFKKSEHESQSSQRALRVGQAAAVIAICLSATGILPPRQNDMALANPTISSQPTLTSFSSQKKAFSPSFPKAKVKSTASSESSSDRVNPCATICLLAQKYQSEPEASAVSNNLYLEKLRAELERLKQESKNQRTTHPQWLKQRRPRQTHHSSSNTFTVQPQNRRRLDLPVLAPLRRFSSDAPVPQRLLMDSGIATRFNGYIWPARGVLTSGYGWRRGRMHKGIDLAGPIGTPILAAASGQVIFAGWNSGGYGNLVKLRHPDGSTTIYAHNQRILVRRGQKVRQGQQIAAMGSTGYSRGSHLHFEIHRQGRGAVNPMSYLSKKRR